jgi:hypothetical protein
VLGGDVGRLLDVYGLMMRTTSGEGKIDNVFFTKFSLGVVIFSKSRLRSSKFLTPGCNQSAVSGRIKKNPQTLLVTATDPMLASTMG